MNVVVPGEGTIKSKVRDAEVIITPEDIKKEFNLPATSDPGISSYSFNQTLFWEEIKSEIAPAYLNFPGIKKALLKPVWERMIDIIYKCWESKIAGIYEITPEKITTLHAIIYRYKCKWAKHVVNSLDTFILKVITPGFKTINVNVRYGFLVTHLLRKKGIQMGKGTEIHSHASLFRTSIKGTKKKSSKKKSTNVEKSLSSNAPLTLIKRKRVQKLVEVDAIVYKENSIDREPVVKRMRKAQPIVEIGKVGEHVIVAKVKTTEGEAEANEDRTPEQVASSPIHEVEVSNPTGQIRRVLDDLNREKEVSTPL